MKIIYYKAIPMCYQFSIDLRKIRTHFVMNLHLFLFWSFIEKATTNVANKQYFCGICNQNKSYTNLHSNIEDDAKVQMAFVNLIVSTLILFPFYMEIVSHM